ncbi:MAG: Xaa-Pro aminopeptidase, partial [Firmicutes bacterium]|nr:Xaa-Pro aminopeptidase [Bacillota bacterium]
AKLQSGTAIQCDIISEAPAPYFGIHTEDGLVLADKMLRNQLKELYPEVWQRIVRRRTVMIEQLGYELHEDVLPLSDLQGFVTPYLLNPNLALCYRD